MIYWEDYSDGCESRSYCFGYMLIPVISSSSDESSET